MIIQLICQQNVIIKICGSVNDAMHVANSRYSAALLYFADYIAALL
jgi:hypothetical protein